MLTNVKCQAAKPGEKIYRLADANGLCLEVRPNGVKAWRYRYRLAGKENMYAIGNYPEVSLLAARVARDQARDLVKNGIHPARQRSVQKIIRANELNDTFEGVALEWIESNRAHWSEGYLENVKRRLEVDAFPDLGRLPIRDVLPAHVLAVLKKVGKRSVTQAKLLQTWVGGVFRFAVANLRRDDDPCWPLRGAIKTQTQVNHHPVLRTDAQIGGFLNAIESAVGEFATKAAVLLMWNTVCRLSEVIGARWEEFDMEKRLWTIPKERMKARVEHVVPLTDRALAIIESMRPLSGRLEYVFPHRSDRKKCMSTEAVRDLFRRAGYHGIFTPHGVRGTFSTMAYEARLHGEAIELCLAHKERNRTKAAYNHALLLEERREILNWWSDVTNEFSKGKGGKVSVLRKA